MRKLLLCVSMLMLVISTLGQTYELVKSVNDLTEGKYLIVYSDAKQSVAAGNYNFKKYIFAPPVEVSINKKNQIVEPNSQALVWDISKAPKGYNISVKIKKEKYYLEFHGSINSNKVYLKKDGNINWDISINEKSQAEIKNLKVIAKFFQYNSTKGQERFSCYKGTQKHVSLFKLKTTAPKPTITNVSIVPKTPTIKDEVTVSAMIATADKAQLLYGFKEGAEAEPVDFALNPKTKKYEGIIPATQAKKTVYYKIIASNASGTTENKGNYTTQEASVTPTITDVTINPKTPTLKDAVTVSAKVKSSTKPRLYYGLKEGEENIKVDFERDGSNIQDITYKGIIPAINTSKEVTVYYKIVATPEGMFPAVEYKGSYKAMDSEIRPVIKDVAIAPQEPTTKDKVKVIAVIDNCTEAQLFYGFKEDDINNGVEFKYNKQFNQYEGLIPETTEAKVYYKIIATKKLEKDEYVGSYDVKQNENQNPQGVIVDALCGGKGYEFIYASTKVADGYISVGRTKSYGAKGFDAFINKVSFDGELKWYKLVGDSGNDFFDAVTATTDGNVVAVGQVKGKLCAVKFALNGDIVWNKEFDGLSRGYGICEVEGKNLFIVGSVDDNAFILKINEGGEKIWSKEYGNINDVSGKDILKGVAVDKDGNYLATGYSNTKKEGDYEAWLLKLTPEGKEIWSEYYGGLEKDQTISVATLTDGNYCIAGQTKSYGSPSLNGLLMKINKDGKLQWAKTYGDRKYDYLNGIVATPNGVLAVGVTKSYSPTTMSNGWLLEADLDGNLVCNYNYGDDKKSDILWGIKNVGADKYLLTGYKDVTKSKAKNYDQWLMLVEKSDLLKINNIKHSVEMPTVTQSLTVSADIISGVDSAKLFYGEEKYKETNVLEFANVSGNKYQAEIPAQNHEVIYYKIVAYKGKEVVSAYGSYATLRPVITDVAINPTEPTATDDVTLSAKITNITEVSLFWGVAEGEETNKVDFNKGTDDIYTGVIPASTADEVFYKIVAKLDEVEVVKTGSYTPQKPQITGVTINPTEPTTKDEVVVKGTVVFANEVKLMWGTTEGQETNEVAFTETSDADIYEGVIPATTEAKVYYKIVAKLSEVEVVETGSYDVKQIVKPTIENVAINPKEPTATDEVTVSATVTNADEVKLFYGFKDGEETTEVAFASANADGNYEGKIPATTEAKVYYKITATKDGETVEEKGSYTIKTTGTGINDENIVSYKLYPNPATTVCNIELTALQNGDVTIQIMNIAGQVMFVETYQHTGYINKQINLNDFAKGVYFVKIQTNNITDIKRLVIN